MTAAATTGFVPSSGVNAELVEKAVVALLKYHEHHTSQVAEERGKLPLLGADRAVQVQINLDRVPSKHQHKPIRVLIPHPLYKVQSKEGEDEDRTSTTGVEEPSVCLIVKEESKVWVKEMVTRFHKHMGCIQKVLGLESLRKKHSRYDQRRELLHKYDVFLADDRILPMVGKALGRDFYKYKRLPIPIKLTRKEALPFAVQNALKATFFTLSQGDCVMVRAGNTGMPLKSLVENVVAICENAVPNIPRKWANIRAIAIKTPDSTSLPIYNKTPEELMEIARLAGIEADKIQPEEEADEEKDKDAEDEEELQQKKKKVAKSPLVRAVKRQLEETKDKKEPTPTKKLKMETKETDQAAADNNAKESHGKRSKKQKKSNNGDDQPSKSVETSKPVKEVAKDVSKTAAPETKAKDDSKTPKSKRDPESNEEMEKVTPKTKKAKSDKSTPLTNQSTPKPAEKEKHNKKDTEDSSKSKKKNKTLSAPKADDAKPFSTPKQSSEAPAFLPSPKFKGSKTGYVFKNGTSGVGYYVDVKPDVDPMVLEALTKVSKKSSASGKRYNSNSKANRSQGKRKSRHSR